jgi:hypothetical protein
MGNFVNPEPIRLTIGGGDYIDIKKRLNHGETEELYARISPYVVPGEPTKMNRREVRTATVLMYLLGWSLADDEGTPVAFSPVLPEAERLDAIHSLDPDRFTDIYAAIEKHEQAYAAEQAKKKKTLSTEQVSPAISPSPVAVA